MARDTTSVFLRFRAALFLAAVLCGSPLHAQTILRLTDTHTYDVTSIKPADPDAKGMMMRFNASGTETTNLPVSEMILHAYRLSSVSEIEGLPSWAKTDRFDIRGKPSPEYSEELDKMTIADRSNHIAQMNQRLLQDRFALKAHIEMRHHKIIRLVQASERPNTRLAVTKEGKGMMSIMPAAFKGEGVPINALCDMLSKLPELGQRVVDGTGLTRKYDFELHWLPADQENAGTQTYPALNQALQEQLGLKLERVMGDSEVLVVDSISQPGEN